MNEARNIIIKLIALAAVLFLLISTVEAARISLDLSGIANVRPDKNALSSEYILPDSDSRYYTYDELDALSDEQLSFAHNEIYARHGRMFNDERYAEHFAACSWYRPRYSAEDYDAMPSQLNEYEKANSDLMAQIRTERGIY